MNTRNLVIRPFQPGDADAFVSLNRHWLIENQLLEPADERQLADYDAQVLQRGGEIFIAVLNGARVGCCAAIPRDGGRLELAKLAVDPSAQGHGIGRQLAEAVVRFAAERGFSRVVLTSNSALRAAIRLYESLGFERHPVPADVPYASVDVYMELPLASR